MRQRSTLLLTITLIGLFLIGCGDNNTFSSENDEVNRFSFDINKMKAMIHEKTNRFTEAHISKDTAFLNNIFTIDARSFPPNSDAVIGRSAISQLNTEWVNYGVYEFTETTTSFYGNEEYLIDEGTYYLSYGPENTIDKGKYINIWKKVEGDWKICSNIWNTSLPTTLE